MHGFDADEGRSFLGGCVAVFALPFAIGGVNILTAGIRALHRGESNAPVLLAIGTGFTALSVAFVALIAFAMRQAQAAARRRNVNPMQPWLWRDDWAARRVAEANPRGRAALLIFALMWNAITIPIAVLVAPSPVGMRVPFAFDLPADAPSSDLSKPNDLVLWQLAVAAEMPGIDYKAAFELPVFVTAGEAAAHHAARRQEAARRELSPA